MTQTDAILNHLKSGKPITSLEALNLFGCLRLAARIRDIKQQGYEIKTEMISRNFKLYASYSLTQTERFVESEPEESEREITWASGNQLDLAI